MLGILTIAQGQKRYIDMAKILALSLKLNSPGIKRAIVTDAPEYEFNGYYDICIPYEPAYGNGLNQKLYLDKYTPFGETLFIDSDCLVVKPLDETIRLCAKYEFAVFGGQVTSGEWYMDVAAMRTRFGLPSLPMFNGGTYYFRQSEVVSNIYNKSRELREKYNEHGFTGFRNSINEEPVMAVAMALNHVEAVDDKGIGMRTPIGIEGALKMDILKQKCRFNKEGEIVEPAIVHFSGGYASQFHYKRETAKLKFIKNFSFLNKSMASAIVNLYFNVPYAILVFFKRITKMVLRKQKFDFSNTLPVYSNY
jgi:hypothetical protein